MIEINCNNKECQHNEQMKCTCERIYYVNRLCMTFRKRSQSENIKALMRVNQSNCHRSGGKFKVDHITVIK